MPFSVITRCSTRRSIFVVAGVLIVPVKLLISAPAATNSIT